MNKLIYTMVILMVMSTHSLAGNIEVGSQFSYQGELQDGGSPANGVYDLIIQLYDSDAGGNSIDFNVFQDVSINNGLFNVELDFGDLPFNGDASWLEVNIRAGDSTGGYTILLPRQRVNVTPYAIQSAFVENGNSPWVDVGGGAINYSQDVYIGNANTTSSSIFTIDSPANESPLRAKINGSTKMIIRDNGGTSIGLNSVAPDNGLRVEGDTDLAGNLLQGVDNFGAIKAALTVTCSTASSIDKSFNAVNGQAFTIDDTIALGNGSCAIDFPFDLSDRFFVAMVKRQNDTRVVSCNDLDNDTLICATSTVAGTLSASIINILVY